MMPKKNESVDDDLKTIPPEKWDAAKKDLKEIVGKRGKSPNVFIYLDEKDIRELKKKGSVDYDKVRITFVKTKK